MLGVFVWTFDDLVTWIFLGILLVCTLIACVRAIIEDRKRYKKGR